MILPRPYQAKCVSAILDAFANYKSALAVLATGLGKTVIAALLARSRPAWRVLMMAHREELVRQAADKLQSVCGEPVGVEMAEERAARSARLVVASVQTLARPGRREQFARDAFDLLITDEAHHAVAKSYRDVIDHFAGARHLGITATPRRGDQLAMGQVYEHVAYDYGLSPAIDDGYLVPVRQCAVKVEGMDFSGLRSVAGDLSDADIERIVTEERILHAMAVPSLDLAGDRPGLVFCATVKHAQLMAAVLNRYKPRCAVALSGETPKDERREWVARYQDGQVQWLCNCGLFLEGFDAPHTSVVVMGRPTKSLALYSQVLGRGTRPLPGLIDAPEISGEDSKAARRDAIAGSDKPVCTVLDFVGNSGRHKIVTALDVLGGKFGEPVRAYAQKTIADEEKNGARVEDALERAEAELALLEEERRRIKARAVTYDAREVSPLDGRAGGGTVGEATPQDEPCSRGQAWLLHKRFGWNLKSAERLGRTQASTIITRLMKKEAKDAA